MVVIGVVVGGSGDEMEKKLKKMVMLKVEVMVVVEKLERRKKMKGYGSGVRCDTGEEGGGQSRADSGQRWVVPAVEREMEE